MPEVKVRFKKRKTEVAFDVPNGGNLIRRAQELGIDMRYQCAEATCGKCVCMVLGGAENLSGPNQAEYDRLGRDLIDRIGFRLACQMRVFGPAEVEQR